MLFLPFFDFILQLDIKQNKIDIKYLFKIFSEKIVGRDLMGVVCGFCGHSDAPESLRIELKETIADLIREKNVHLFYVGNHGGFDRMVLGVLQELQASFPVWSKWT